jgi:hypothetical protein
MRVMSDYRSEHYQSKQARAVAGEPWNQEQCHGSKFGNPDHEPKPVEIAPAMEITNPRYIARLRDKGARGASGPRLRKVGAFRAAKFQAHSIRERKQA